MAQPVLSDLMARKVRESFSRQTFLATLRAEIITLEYGRCALRAPHQPGILQQHGFIHAGVVTTLADTAAGYAALSTLGEDAEVLSAEFKINLLAPAVGEYVIAEAEVVRSGRTLVVVSAAVYAYKAEQRKQVALFQSTMIAVPRDNYT